MSQEESILRETFPTEYLQYERRVKRLLPWILQLRGEPATVGMTGEVPSHSLPPAVAYAPGRAYEATRARAVRRPSTAALMMPPA